MTVGAILALEINVYADKQKTAVLALGLVLFALVLSACGGTPQPTPGPTPDIDATVEARIEEKQAEDANIEAKAQAMAKAIVEATAEAAPTITPTTPTSTVTPTPPSFMSILTKAKKAMDNVQSYKLDMDAVIKAKTEEMTLEIPITSTGFFQAPDRLHMKTSGNLMGFLDLGNEFIQIGNKQYEKGPGETEWTRYKDRVKGGLRRNKPLVLSIL